MSAAGIQAEDHTRVAMGASNRLRAEEPFGHTIYNFVLRDKLSTSVGRIELLEARVKAAVALTRIVEAALGQGMI